MQKDKMLKIIIIFCIFLMCGILYSCNISHKNLYNDESDIILSDESDSTADNEADSLNDKQPNVADSKSDDGNDADAFNAADASDKVIKEPAKEKNIYVYVCGAVNNAGVYEMKENSRVYEAIEAAGGIREDGDGEFLNQAMVLNDADKIIVPTKEEAEELKKNQVKEYMNNALMTQDSNTNSDKGSDNLININTASVAELMNLPGIGQSKAEKIIAYRENNGKFAKAEDLMQIEGIKEGVYNKIKDLITVD